MIVLFDFDGVLVDTETQYSVFWDGVGRDFLGVEDFGWTIKGQTLKQIYEKHITSAEDQEKVTLRLDEFERNMSYDFLPGVTGFLTQLKSAGIRSAIVTSSNDKKMTNVHRAHPELSGLIDRILTSEDFRKSKPDPECFLKGMEVLGGKPEDTIVFEDSLHGLAAGRASGAFVVGLSTTFPAERIEGLCDLVISDFRGLDIGTLITMSQNLAD